MSRPKLETAYLYGDGHAVLVYEKQDRDAGTVRFVDIVEKFGPEVLFEGRVILKGGMIDLVRSAFEVAASDPTRERGSDNTRRLDLRVGYLTVRPKKHSEPVSFVTIPDVLTENFTIQTEVHGEFGDDSERATWDDMPVRKVIREGKAVQEVA